MKFEAIQRETVILDPNNNMERKTIPSEIRKDPLTGRTSRICHFMPLKWEKPDFDQLVAGTQEYCPFCPDKVMQVTPCFPEDIVPEGRMILDDKVLFPNIAPYDSLGACATFSGRHFIPMTDITPGHIVDAFRLAIQFFQRVDQIKHPESVYHLINWNYMPASVSSLIHPHLQVFASAYAPHLLQEELSCAETYHNQQGSNYWDDLVKTEETGGQRSQLRGLRRATVRDAGAHGLPCPRPGALVISGRPGIHSGSSAGTAGPTGSAVRGVSGTAAPRAGRRRPAVRGLRPGNLRHGLRPARPQGRRNSAGSR